MDRKKRHLSFVLILTILAGLLCGNRTALALPDMEVSLSEDLMLTWTDVEGATEYRFWDTEEGSNYERTLTEKPFNLGAFLKSKKRPSKSNYSVQVLAYKENDSGKMERIASKWVYFNYESPLETLSAPQNIRIEGDKLVWDPCVSSSGSKVKYYTNWKSTPMNMTVPIYAGSLYTYDSKVDMAFFHRDGTYTYEFEIVAMADDCVSSPKATAAYEYTVHLPAFQNVTLEDGVISWDAFEDEQDLNYQVEVYSEIHGGYIATSSENVFRYNNRVYWNIANFASKEHLNYEEGEEITYMITARKDADTGAGTKSQVPYKECEGEWIFSVIEYPIKFHGKRQTSADNIFVDNYYKNIYDYIPSENRLIGKERFYYIPDCLPFGDGFDVHFESDKDLYISGTHNIEIIDPMFQSAGAIVFDKDCIINATTTTTFATAKSMSLLGSSFNLTTENNIALSATSGIVVNPANPKDSVEITTSEGFAAMHTTSSKITLSQTDIIEPENGTLGQDAKSIYESDGKTPAFHVILVKQTATPSPSKSPDPTKKATPTPTKEVTPTKKATPTPTKKATPTKAPTKVPTQAPTMAPTKAPTKAPTMAPTKAPTKAPTRMPTLSPTPTRKVTPTKAPTRKPTLSPTPTTAPVKEPSIADFVERLYTIALNRESEPEGKAFWVNEIESGNRTGGDCAHFFLIEAQEFLNRGLNNEDFVETLYLTFFDRASEPAGKKFWVDGLKSGKMTKEYVINGFIDSTEWCNVCATYGVKSGAPHAKAEFASKNAIKFATRLYTECLGRVPEEGGLKYWSLALTNLEQTGCSAAKNFFTSAEFIGFKLKNEEYVRRLYTTFMGRDPEASEIAYWAGEIRSGRQTKESVMAFFGQSEEFTNICKLYGIDRGTI